MRSVFFTKPKETTQAFLRFMVEQGEEVLAVVLSGASDYEGSGLVRLCRARGIEVVDHEECASLFARCREDIDMIWCHTYPRLLKGEWIGSASRAAVNFHAAPLPDYRGVFAYNFAILNGEKEFGVTAHVLGPEFDAGDIIEVDRFPVDCSRCSVSELVEASEVRLLALSKKVYQRFLSGEEIRATPQRRGAGHYYSRKDFERAKRISPADSDGEVERRVRAFWFPPYEGAYVEVEGRRYCVVTEEVLHGLR